jgi:hypothetical protein
VIEVRQKPPDHDPRESLTMRLHIDSKAYRYTLSKAFEPKVDRTTGAVAVDRDTGRSLQIGQLVAIGPLGAEILGVTIAADAPITIALGDPVNVTGLIAIPWATKEGEVRVAFRAESVTPALSSTKAA